MTTQVVISGRVGDAQGRRALAAVTVTVAAWASAFVVIRGLGNDFSPGPLALGRLLIGSLVLGGAILLRRRWVRPTAREWTLLATCGLAWFAIYNVALNAAEQRIDAGTAAMLVNVGPILIAVLAGVALREGFPPWLVAGALVSFGGALMLGLASARGQHASLDGVLLCLLAAAAYAVGMVAQKPVLRRLPALQVTGLSAAIGALGCLPYLPELIDEAGAAPGGALTGLVYLGIVPTAVAFGTCAYALARMDAGRLGISTYLVPPLTILIAWAFLAEVPEPLAIAGGLVCLVGVALSRRRG